MKIPVIDDDPGTLKALKAGLTSFGFELVIAKDGRQALSVIESSIKGSEPDVTGTDLKS